MCVRGGIYITQDTRQRGELDPDICIGNNVAHMLLVIVKGGIWQKAFHESFYVKKINFTQADDEGKDLQTFPGTFQASK